MSFTKYTSNHIYGLIITYLCPKVNRFLFLERVIIALSHIYAEVALLSEYMKLVIAVVFIQNQADYDIVKSTKNTLLGNSENPEKKPRINPIMSSIHKIRHLGND